MSCRRPEATDQLANGFHRGAVAASTQAYYLEWLEYEGRNSTHRIVPTIARNTSQDIKDLYESLSDWSFAAECWCEQSDRYFYERRKNDYYFKSTSHGWQLSRSEEGAYPSDAPQGMRADTGQADSDRTHGDRR